MNHNNIVSASKFLSLVLRHNPGKIGISLDPEGWVDVEALLAACVAHRKPMTRAWLEEIVATNDKQRFSFSADGARIRANQGHSVEVDLGLPPSVPPETLFHGTVEKYLDSIRRDGLVKGNRRHVHLSKDEETARKVGQRRGRPILLIVASLRMHDAGHPFYISDNGVWLVDSVPPEFLQFP